MAEEIHITPADINAMFQENPLALEQTRRIALQRELETARAEVAKLNAQLKAAAEAPKAA